jgi:hypothetical protein
MQWEIGQEKIVAKHTPNGTIMQRKNLISQPSVDISLIWIPFIIDEVTKSKDHHDILDSPWFIHLIHQASFSLHQWSWWCPLPFVSSLSSQFLYTDVRDLAVV